MRDTRARMRAWWQQLAAIMLKEAKQVTRDPSSWIIAVVLPLTFLFLFGYGISLDTTVIRVAVVREDDGRDARALAAALTDSKWFAVVAAHDRGSGERLLQDQLVKAVVIIPAEFGQRLDAENTTAQVQVLVDGAEPNTANYVHAYVNTIWNGFLAARGVERGSPRPVQVSLEARYWYNANAVSRWFLIPGSMTGYMPAMMLSGFLFDIRSMPPWLQVIMLATPARYMNVSLQTVFLAGDVWAVLVPNMLFMLAVGALFFGLTWRRLHKRLD